MRLALIRHGEAEDAAAAGGRDEARRLTPDGRRAMACTAAAFEALGWKPDAIWSSRWARAWESAQIVAQALGAEAALAPEPALEGPPDEKPIVERLRAESGASRLALVGHNPSLEQLAAYLIGAAGRQAVRLKKGGVALLDADRIEAGGATLEALWSPRMIRELAKTQR